MQAQQTKAGPTELQRQLISRGIRAGCDGVTAASRAGVEARTFYDWMSRGEREFSGPCRDLYDDVQKAELAAAQLNG